MALILARTVSEVVDRYCVHATGGVPAQDPVGDPVGDPDLSFCSALGATPHEAVAEVETAIEAWLGAAAGSGRPLPAPSAPARRA